MTGSSSDEAAGRVRAFLHGYREDDDSEIIEHINRDVTLTVGDLRALVDEREQLRAIITADGEHSWALAMERDAATARAKQAEALAAERVEAARQREETWRDSAMQANAELETLRAGLGKTMPVPRGTLDMLVHVATHVSLGRRAAFTAPYPDATARFALGALREAGLWSDAGEGDAT